MDALTVANLAREMAVQLDGPSRCFLEAARQTGGVQQALCYRHSGVGDRLMLLAAAGVSPEALPFIDMGELDNPLVYSLREGCPCLIDSVTSLVAIGGGCDSLRERLPESCGLLVLPVRSAQQQALGVVALAGPASALRTWRDDPVWQALAGLHEQLFASLHARGEVERGIDSERTQRTLEAGQGRTRAERLLAAEFIGTGAAARQIRADLLRLADSSLATLITGETGTGKDHAAWLIHQASSRSGPFVPVNCAAIPRELIEAELFGSARGAFTGATRARQGLVAEADGGTLFLDEIGDMPMTLQGTLLRVLNEKKYRPVGETRERISNFRLICATHQPLPRMILDGLFREDLYFRIRQQTLHLPALRERMDDISALAMHVLLQYNRENRTRIAGIEPEAHALLREQPFPGNVRQLRNLVFAAAERTEPRQAISTDTLRTLLVDVDNAPARHEPEGAAVHELLRMERLPDAVEAFERLMISRRLQRAGGSRSGAAQSLGIPKRTLAHKCQKWNLDQENHLS